MTISATLSALRVRSRAAAAQHASAAQAALVAAGNPACTDSGIARAWGISHAYVARLFDAESGVAITHGDVLALPDALARAILVRSLASLDARGGPTTRDTLDRIGVELGHALGDYLADLRDGREDRDDVHEANLTRLAAIVLRGIAGIQQRRAAREAAK